MAERPSATPGIRPLNEQHSAPSKAHANDRAGGEGGDRASVVGKPVPEADERTAGSDAAYDGVDATAGDLSDDLAGRLIPMSTRIVGIRKLKGLETAAPAATRAAIASDPPTPSARGENTTSPPHASMMRDRSRLTPSGITATKRRPI